VKLYLDSSALVKLVQQESETSALRRFLRRHRADGRVTSTLARVEVVRAVAAGGPLAIAHARRQLGRIDQVHLDRVLLDDAATLSPSIVLRSLDAIHLATARSIGADLRSVVTYDQRMQAAADALGIVVDAPGGPPL
jgi:predicted nucleic acid-binding protein